MILKNPPFSPVPDAPGMDLYFARVRGFRIWFYLTNDTPPHVAHAKVEAFKRGEQVYVELIEPANP